MIKVALKATVVALAFAWGTTALAQDEIKIGILGPFSGPYAHYGQLFENGAKSYMALNKDAFEGKSVKIIYRDTKGPNPALTRSLAQELIVKDKVDYLGGVVFTPNAYALAPLATAAKVPFISFLAAGTDVTEKSPYFIRTSFTLSQVATPLAKWARAHDINTVVTAVSDYATGYDAENVWTNVFEGAGGQVLDKLRMPMNTADYTPFAQQILNAKPNAVFTFLPGGPPNLGFVKAYHENGLAAAGVQFLGNSEADEHDLQKYGPAALGMITAYHYSADHKSALNDELKEYVAKVAPDVEINYSLVAAYDGMHVMSELAKSRAKGADLDQAIKDISDKKWESPRGEVFIDGKTRHITQHIYLRVASNDDASGRIVNKEVEDLGVYDQYGEKVE